MTTSLDDPAIVAGSVTPVFEPFVEPVDDPPEEVVVVHDRVSGLRAVISIHSTVLGPALGGCRFHPYNTVAEAMADAMRLGRAMTAKASLAGLDLGGGKAVIIGDPHTDRTEARLRAFGKMVERLDGRYITAEDVGTTVADMDLIGQMTDHVAGRSPEESGSGDPSGSTALGVFEALRSTVGFVTDSSDLDSVRVTVLGVGKVGRPLVELLVDAGADVTISDVDRAAVEALTSTLAVHSTRPDQAHRLPTDVFSPCALGGILNARTIPELRCRMVVGSANNQLAEADDADRLMAAGITYAPDFLVNAGGLIHVADERHGFDPVRVEHRVREIGPITSALFREAAALGESPLAAADRLARLRIAERLQAAVTA